MLNLKIIIINGFAPIKFGNRNFSQNKTTKIYHIFEEDTFKLGDNETAITYRNDKNEIHFKLNNERFQKSDKTIFVIFPTKAFSKNRLKTFLLSNKLNGIDFSVLLIKPFDFEGRLKSSIFNSNKNICEELDINPYIINGEDYINNTQTSTISFVDAFNMISDLIFKEIEKIY